MSKRLSLLVVVSLLSSFSFFGCQSLNFTKLKSNNESCQRTISSDDEFLNEGDVLLSTDDGLNPESQLKVKRKIKVQSLTLTQNQKKLATDKEALDKIFAEWDGSLVNGEYPESVNSKYIDQVDNLVKEIFELENVAYYHPNGADKDNQYRYVIKASKETKDNSDLNTYAYEMYNRMDKVKVMYDPLDLYRNNYGGSYDENKNVMRLSNYSITSIDGVSLNEVHESVHAKVADFQNNKSNNKMWHPFWAQLMSLDVESVKGFRPPYTRSIFLDEIMAYHKQITYLVSSKYENELRTKMMNEAEVDNVIIDAKYLKRIEDKIIKTRSSQFDLYFSTLLSLSKSIVDTLPTFKIENNYDFKNTLFLKNKEEFSENTGENFEAKLEKDHFENPHLYINKNGYIFNLMLDFKYINQLLTSKVLTDLHFKLAAIQLKAIEEKMNKLLSVYSAIQKLSYSRVNQSDKTKIKLLKAEEYAQIEKLLLSVKDIVLLDQFPIK